MRAQRLCDAFVMQAQSFLAGSAVESHKRFAQTVCVCVFIGRKNTDWDKSVPAAIEG